MPELLTIEAPADGVSAIYQFPSDISFDAETSTIARSGLIDYGRAREIRRNPTVHLARLLAASPVLASSWAVEVKDGAPQGLDDLLQLFVNFKSIICKTAMFGMIDYGWSGLECVWQQSPNTGLLEPVDFVRLLVDITSILVDAQTGQFTGFRQKFTDPNGNDLDISITGLAKCLHFAQNVEGGNHYGESDLENLDGTMTRYDAALTIADAFDKKTAGSVWIIRYPNGVTKVNGAPMDNGQIAQGLMQSLRSNGSMCIPRNIASAIGPAAGGAPFNKLVTDNDWEIELKEPTGATSSHLLSRLEYLDKLICRGLGQPERSMLEGKHGTKAEAEAHADVALTQASDRGDYIISQLNAGPVRAAIELNFGPEAVPLASIKTSPIGADEKAFLRELYGKFIASPDTAVLEMQSTDMSAMREIIGVPSASNGLDDDPLARVRDAINANVDPGTSPDGTGGI